jgi:hypothetical protein
LEQQLADSADALAAGKAATALETDKSTAQLTAANTARAAAEKEFLTGRETSKVLFSMSHYISELHREVVSVALT